MAVGCFPASKKQPPRTAAAWGTHQTSVPCRVLFPPGFPLPARRRSLFSAGSVCMYLQSLGLSHRDITSTIIPKCSQVGRWLPWLLRGMPAALHPCRCSGSACSVNSNCNPYPVYPPHTHTHPPIRAAAGPQPRHQHPGEPSASSCHELDAYNGLSFSFLFSTKGTGNLHQQLAAPSPRSPASP